MADIPKKIFFDVPNEILRNSGGEELTTEKLFPSATFGQKFWVNIQLTKNGVDTKYKDLTTGSSGEVIVDNDYKNASPIFSLPGDSGSYWTVSSGAEYYYNGDEVTATPANVYLNTIEATEGTLGALNASEWAWDTANSRLVVRLADDTDPDTKADSWVTYKITITDETTPFIEVDSVTFNQALSWYDTTTEAFRNPVITDGELSFYVTANTQQFYNRLDNKQWKTTTTMQVQMHDPSSAELYKIFEFQFVCKNLYLGAGFTLNVAGSNFYTKAEVNALLAGYEPKFLQVLSSVDFTTVQLNTVYTVPSGKLFKPEFGDILTTTLTGTIAALKYKWLADSTDLFPEFLTAMAAINDFDGVELNPVKYWPAGTIFKMSVTVASTATAHTGKAILQGVLIDA